MTRILFVCHGNICRSPMAEFIMKALVAAEGLADRFLIASAATSAEELGNPVYPPVAQLLHARGIDCSKKRAVRVQPADYDRYDYILCMDGNNQRNLQRIFPKDPAQKIALLMSFTGEAREVADPWYTRDFLAAERDILSGCRALLAALQAQGTVK